MTLELRDAEDHELEYLQPRELILFWVVLDIVNPGDPLRLVLTESPVPTDPGACDPGPASGLWTSLTDCFDGYLFKHGTSFPKH